ncbi:uncharacterized protein [Musca autumnalis]|uniref:uncharacterized protein n=1 Tax=Musca autumnalis TaxID=221902 RepID=UPI003CF045FC
MPGFQDSGSSMDTLDVIQEYFAKLNPIAERIYHDINDTKVNYGKLWNSLNYHEQADIINDTLIKPEISLHYFDSFHTPQTNSTKSHQTSTDSLAAIVLNDFKNCGGGRDKEIVPLKQFDAKYSKNEGHGFDGRDLRTFSIQTVAMKIIQDDNIGSFRDEYSRPFSYRTKSQINLHLFSGDMSGDSWHSADKQHQLSLYPGSKDSKQEPLDAESKKTLLNYHRLQCELKKSLNQNIQKSRLNDVQKSGVIKPSSITSPIINGMEAKTRKSINNLQSPINADVEKSNSSIKAAASAPKPSKSSSSSIMQVFLNSNNSSAPPPATSSNIINYAVYTDNFLDVGEEKTNLMQNCGGRGGQFLLSASSSSTATSEDDEYDGQADKTLDSEEVYLLDRDIRKGFDFLNNW